MRTRMGVVRRAGELPGRRGSRARWLGLGASALAGGLVLAACSSSSSTSTASAGASAASPTGNSAAPVQKALPGVSGTVAALDPASSSMEVQNPATGQTTVSWTASTAFVQTVQASLSSVVPGDCVVVTGTPAAGPSSSPTTVDALRVSLSQPPAGGSCLRRPGASRSSGSAGAFGAFTGGFAALSGAGANGEAGTASTPRTVASVSGTVQRVSGSSIVVQGFSRSFTVTPGKRPSGTFRRPASSGSASVPPTTTVTVQTTSTTTFTQTGPSSASALAVGECVTAIGPSSSTGAVTARSVAISQPGPSGCASGFGRFGAHQSSGSAGNPASA
jgi:hypothetical protein